MLMIMSSIIRDNDPIENCCDLGFGHSKFNSVVNKPKVYDVKNLCGNCPINFHFKWKCNNKTK